MTPRGASVVKPRVDVPLDLSSGHERRQPGAIRSSEGPG
jgi:hypothetical protein